MSKNLKYILSLDDKMSSKLSKIGIASGTARDGINKINTAAEGLKSTINSTNKVLGALGISFGLYQLGSFITSSVEKTKTLDEAQAQLTNTMKNMGVYSSDSYDKAVTGAATLAKGIKYSKAEIIGLQSQIRLVGNVTESEMQRMITASADLATKFDIGLNEAGNTIAKSVNNPEMMRRLGMQLKIDPTVVENIQNLAKNGQEAAARLKLIGIIEDKIGGAAQAAFNADPLAKYNKAMGSIKIELGEAAIKIQEKLAPALETVASWFKNLAKTVVSCVRWLTEHKKTTLGLAVGLGILTIALTAATIATKLKIGWDSILLAKTRILTIAIWLKNAAITAYTYISVAATTATSFWEGAQFLLNAAFYACPIVWIIAGIIGLIAVIGYVVKKTDGWGETWSNLMTYLDTSWQIFKTNFEVIWLNVQDTFLTGVEFIEKAWYKLKSLWDEDSANSELLKINDEQNKRAEEIAKTKGKLEELKKERAKIDIWQVKWNDKSLSDITGGLKNKLGLTTPTVSNMNTGTTTTKGAGTLTSSAGESITAGGTRSTNIMIDFKNLVENIIFNGTTKENKDEIVNNVGEALLRVLNMANSVQS